MDRDLLKPKRFYVVMLLEAAVISLMGAWLLPVAATEPHTKYILLICLSIPLFLTFSVLKYGSMEKNLKEITKRMLLFLLTFVCLIILCGLISGAAAVVLNSAVRDRWQDYEIMSAIRITSGIITCLMYPVLAGAFMSFCKKENSTVFSDLIKKKFGLTPEKYLILLVIALATSGAGSLVMLTENTVIRTAVSAAAGALCLFLSMMALSDKQDPSGVCEKTAQ